MKLGKVSTVAAIAAAALCGGLSVAQADAPNNFASFYESTAANSFVFTNTGAGSTLVCASTPITFVFQSPNTYGAIGQAIPGVLTLSATVNGAASSTVIPGGTYLGQPFNNISFSFTANTPVAGHTNLLSITGGSDNLSALKNGYNVSLGADTVNGDNLVFQSDFLTFGAVTDENYNFALTSSVPAAIDNNGYFTSFNAAGTGIFASAPLPSPEPGTLVSLAVLSGCLGIGLIARKRLSVNS